MEGDSRLWTLVDEYFEFHTREADPVLSGATERAERAGLPDYRVSSNQGAFLSLLVQSIGARSVLEIGTLAGYSTIWLARAVVRGGTVISLEINAEYAMVARANIAAAGLSDTVSILVGDASATLMSLTAEKRSFDFVFIDADKERNALYMNHALQMTHSGSLIVVDNVVREGTIIDQSNLDPRVKGVRALIDMISGDRRVSSTVLQTVGSKGYDGFLLARVT